MPFFTAGNEKSLANCKAFQIFVIPIGLFSNSFLENLKAFTTILDLPEAVINIFSDQLINFIRKQKWLNFLNYDSVQSFIHLKGNLLSEELLDKYFQWFLLKTDGHQAEVLKAIVTRINGKKLKRRYFSISKFINYWCRSKTIQSVPLLKWNTYAAGGQYFTIIWDFFKKNV